MEDPDMPPCMEWSEKQVGDWISSIGFPYLRVPLFLNDEHACKNSHFITFNIQ